jgi:lipid-A-disaccharide synthase
MIVAGEASGDLHGANLVTAACQIDPELRFFGIGGRRMREAGVDVLVDNAEMAVVGLVEVLAHFDVIYHAYATLKKELECSPPDLLILIDYPDFNLRVARVARRCGVRVLYYISPQVWAWRVGRVKKIARLVDRMAVVFPFEVPFYEKEGVPVSFVGHPLVDTVHPSLSRADAWTAFGLKEGRKTVGLFPGSRKGEIRNLLPTLLMSAQLLRDRFPDIQFVLPLASSLSRDDLAPYLNQGTVPVSVVEGQVYDVMQCCDAIVTVSGTVTLEIALMAVPMVIIYRVSPLTYLIGKRLIRVDHIGLCNIVAGERVVQELVQDEADPVHIAGEIARILTDAPYRETMTAQLAETRKRLGSGGGSRNIASLALDMARKG